VSIPGRTDRPDRGRWVRAGFSLVELLVAMAVMGIIGSLLIPLVLTSRQAVQADQIRVGVNQQLRSASDLLGADIRTAGERFPSRAALQLQPIEIVKGSGDDPDEIILRRNLWEGTLPLCQATLAGSTQNVVVSAPDPPDATWNAFPECLQPYLGGWPRNVSEIRDLANEIGEGGVLRGYLWNQSLNDGAGNGEFFNFEIPSSSGDNNEIRRVGGGGWQFTHERVDQPRIYILEERRYRLRDDVLELVINGSTDSALRAVSGITALTAQYILDDDSVVDVLPADTSWRNIRGVSVRLTSSEERGREGTERTLASTFFPRNILSR
jgi:prepilin-type N-terminal cleavage/methylation domain-containing protein